MTGMEVMPLPDDSVTPPWALGQQAADPPAAQGGYSVRRPVFCRYGRASPVLEIQAAGGDDRRRVGIPLRRLWPLLPAQAARRRHQRLVLHQRRLPLARSAHLPVQRLPQPPPPRARLRPPDPRGSARDRLAAAVLCVSPDRRGQGPRLVAPVG